MSLLAKRKTEDKKIILDGLEAEGGDSDAVPAFTFRSGLEDLLQERKSEIALTAVGGTERAAKAIMRAVVDQA